jgi:hypothetical protein
VSDEERAKETNPKDAVGIRKVPFSTIPAQVMAEIGLAMLEGARKYSRHNYRVAGVRASVYYDAAMRHLTAWWEGQDIDPASGLPHVVKALASLTVLRDAQINQKCEDDRPPSLLDQDWVEHLNALAGEIIDRYPDAKEPFVRDRGVPQVLVRDYPLRQRTGAYCIHDINLFQVDCPDCIADLGGR